MTPKRARYAAGLTQSESAALICLSLSAWQQGETRGLSRQSFELFLILTGQKTLDTAKEEAYKRVALVTKNKERINTLKGKENG